MWVMCEGRVWVLCRRGISCGSCVKEGCRSYVSKCCLLDMREGKVQVLCKQVLPVGHMCVEGGREEWPQRA
jgi:hypothetical protein